MTARRSDLLRPGDLVEYAETMVYREVVKVDDQHDGLVLVTLGPPELFDLEPITMTVYRSRLWVIRDWK